EFMALRLEDSSSCSGHLQVFYNGTWGSVCSNSMTPRSISLACKELGCGDRGYLEIHLPYARVSEPAWLDRVQCGERNSSFWHCPSAPWLLHSCHDLRDEAHIICSATRPKAAPDLPAPCPGSGTCTAREKIRAVGGGSSCSGRVEVWLQGSWGTVCDDSWDRQDAAVACRQLGCGPALAAPGQAAFGEGTGPIWLEQVECKGTEPALQDCWARTGDSGACRHKEDAAVECSVKHWAVLGTLLASACCCPCSAPAHADPSGGPGSSSSSSSISVPVLICIILGALLCLLLALLARQVRSARAGHR
ncbi:WC11 protein, partial [Psilopogon haemacephalus]|nr:WC11 protein [Psilopogon haemacephalus]